MHGLNIILRHFAQSKKAKCYNMTFLDVKSELKSMTNAKKNLYYFLTIIGILTGFYILNKLYSWYFDIFDNLQNMDYPGVVLSFLIIIPTLFVGFFSYRNPIKINYKKGVTIIFPVFALMLIYITAPISNLNLIYEINNHVISKYDNQIKEISNKLENDFNNKQITTRKGIEKLFDKKIICLQQKPYEINPIQNIIISLEIRTLIDAKQKALSIFDSKKTLISSDYKNSLKKAKISIRNSFLEKTNNSKIIADTQTLIDNIGQISFKITCFLLICAISLFALNFANLAKMDKQTTVVQNTYIAMGVYSTYILYFTVSKGYDQYMSNVHENSIFIVTLIIGTLSMSLAIFSKFLQMNTRNDTKRILAVISQNMIIISTIIFLTHNLIPEFFTRIIAVYIK